MFAATLTLPVAVSKLSPGGTLDPAATLSVALAAEAAALPTVSPVNTLRTLAAPVEPLTAPTLSLAAVTTELSEKLAEAAGVLLWPMKPCAVLVKIPAETGGLAV